MDNVESQRMTADERDAFLHDLRKIMIRHHVHSLVVFKEHVSGFNRNGTGLFNSPKMISVDGKEKLEPFVL